MVVAALKVVQPAVEVSHKPWVVAAAAWAVTPEECQAPVEWAVPAVEWEAWVVPEAEWEEWAAAAQAEWAVEAVVSMLLQNYMHLRLEWVATPEEWAVAQVEWAVAQVEWAVAQEAWEEEVAWVAAVAAAAASKL